MSSWTGAVVPWDGVVGTPWEGAASRALAEAGVPEVAPEDGAGLVLLDERCPGVTADVVRRVVAAADGVAEGAVAAGVRPVTDTVKVLQDGYVGPTVDRDGLVAVCSPLVVPADLLPLVGAHDDLPGLVERLLARGADVRLVEVPAVARRLGDVDELLLLEGGGDAA